MKMPPLVPADRRDQALARLAGWSAAPQADAIAKTFRFADFAAAFAWMTRCAAVAESMNHHPDWRNVYNRVEVVLTTHSAKGLTDLDLELAAAMNRLAGEEDAHG